METKRITDNIEDAAAIICAGGLVAVPTETVYGLAGCGLNEETVQQIYEVKGRPAVKPLSLMVPDESAMERYCEDVPTQAHQLARCFWPGPLTIVLKAKPEIPPIVLAGGTTVGLRCPDHPMTLALLRECSAEFWIPPVAQSSSLKVNGTKLAGATKVQFMYSEDGAVFCSADVGEATDTSATAQCGFTGTPTQAEGFLRVVTPNGTTNMATLAWWTIASTDPGKVIFSINKGAYTLELLAEKSVAKSGFED